MARYKHYDYSQQKLLPVSFEKQVLPGSFEYTLNELIDNEVDLKVFEDRYHNDETGAPAYDPAILLKIILYAYSRGITQSREIERLCRENVVFMALSADTTPHFTTIAHFISTLEPEIVSIYRDVLLICDEAGLIGREMFAIDGVKLPSNASKEWSGTRADFQKKVTKMERAIRYLVKRHRDADAAVTDETLRAARAKQIKTLKAAVAKVKEFLKDRPEKLGASGKPIQSNITDNDSAKIKTGKGVIQGYAGMAVVDARHQVIVGAQAFGAGANVRGRGNLGVKFRGTKRDCSGCPMRSRCLRTPETTPVRQVVFFLRREGAAESHTARMRRKIDTDEGRHQYSRRLGIVEPVFANINSAHRLRRFSLRGRDKVNTQWQLFCLVHNIGKIQRYGKRRRRSRRVN